MLNSKDRKYKEYLKLRKKLDELEGKLDSLPNIKLKEPYQHGWIIKYDVRDDIKRRKDYPDIKILVECGYRENYTNNVNVVRAIRRGDTKTRIKSRFSKLDHISSYYPERCELNEKAFLSGGRFFDRYFNLNTTSYNYRMFGRKGYYLDIPTYWLVVKIKPNLITHRKKKGGAIEREYMLLRERIFDSGEFFCFMQDNDSSYPAYKDRGKIKNKIRSYLNGKKDDIYNEKIPMIYDH